MFNQFIIQILLTKIIGDIMEQQDPWVMPTPQTSTNNGGNMSNAAAAGTGMGMSALIGGAIGFGGGYLLGRISHNNNVNNFAHHGVGFGVPAVASSPVVVSSTVAHGRCFEGYGEPYNNLIQRNDDFQMGNIARFAHLDKDIAVNREVSKYEAEKATAQVLLANSGIINHIDRTNAANIIEQKNNALGDAYRQIGKLEQQALFNALSCEIKSVAGIAAHAVGEVRELKNCLCECNPKPAPSKIYPDYCAERGELHKLNEILYKVNKIPTTP